MGLNTPSGGHPPHGGTTALSHEPRSPLSVEPAAGSHANGHAKGHGHEHDHGHSHPPPWARLFRLLKVERRDIGVVITFAVWVGVLSLATPIAVESLVNTVALGALLQPLVVLTLLLLACLGLAAILRALQAVAAEVIQRRIFARVVADLSYRLPRVRLEAMDGHHGPELVNRFFDVMTVQKTSAVLLLDGVAVILQTVIGLVILGFYHPALLGYDILLLGSIAIVVFGLGRGGVRTAIAESYAKYAVADWLQELVRHPTAFKISGAYNYAMDRAERLAVVYLNARKAHFRIVLRQNISALLLQAVASTVLLGLGGWLVIGGQLTLGQLVAAELIVTVIVGSFTKLGKQLESYYDLMSAVDKLGHLTDLPVERSEGVPLPERTAPASLDLREVAFAYDQSRPVLRDVSFSLKPGERVGLVGPSGSGKSTLVDLLFGLRATDHGYILLDGVDLRDLALADLRSAVAIVRGGEMIDATVAENVSLGRPGVTADHVREALGRVGLIEEVLAFPDGLQTAVTTTGAPLSQGQLRRLLIARAIASRPRLLVIDETIDAIDVEARDEVLRALFAPDSPWTLLVVSHSEELIERCERVIVLRQGVTEEKDCPSRMKVNELRRPVLTGTKP
jgi:putative ABC transport system ATP-binding protein